MSHQRIVFAALTWNLRHGLATPRHPLRHPLRDELATTLAGLEWDVALLSEAPPRWLETLCRRAGAHGALALTSRNALPWLRARIADRLPDLVASNEGGSNMVLVRNGWRITAIERATLARRPERRRLLLAFVEAPAAGREEPAAARLAVACTHLSVPSTGRGAAELERAAERAVAFAGSAPLLLGGDLNLRPVHAAAAFDAIRARFGLAEATGPRALDHLLVRGLDTVSPPRPLPSRCREIPGPRDSRLRLSDHSPVVAAFGVR